MHFGLGRPFSWHRHSKPLRAQLFDKLKCMSSLLAALAENIRENGRLVGRVGHHLVSQAKHLRALHHAPPEVGQCPRIYALLTIRLRSFVFPADTNLYLKTSYTGIYCGQSNPATRVQNQMSTETFLALSLQSQHLEVSVLKCNLPKDGMSLVPVACQDITHKCNSAVQHRSVRHCCQQIV